MLNCEVEMGQTPNFDPRDYGNEVNDCKNGSLDFWQRVVSNNTVVNTATSVETYTADRFSHSSSGTTVKNYSAQASADVPAFSQALFQAGLSYRFDVLTAIPSPASGDRVLMFKYRMEGYDYRPYHGQKMYVGIWIKSPISGSLPFTFTKFLPASAFESYVTPIVIDSSEVNLWVWKVAEVTLTSSTPNSFTNGHALQMHFGGAIGSSFSATENTWASGERHTFPSAANMFSAIQVFRFALIKISHSYPTPYFVRHGLTYDAELAACQRYYEKTYRLDIVPQTAGQQTSGALQDRWTLSPGSSDEFAMSWRFAVPKRAIPTIGRFSPVTGVAGNMSRDSGVDITSLIWNCGTSETGTGFTNGQSTDTSVHRIHGTADAEL